jgi:hypothetical protein
LSAVDRAELALQRLAGESVKLAERVERVGEKRESVAEKADALTYNIRRWYERHGNGSGERPS